MKRVQEFKGLRVERFGAERRTADLKICHYIRKVRTLHPGIRIHQGQNPHPSESMVRHPDGNPGGPADAAATVADFVVGRWRGTLGGPTREEGGLKLPLRRQSHACGEVGVGRC